MLDRYIDKAYEDKLSDSIPEHMWREKHDRWMSEKADIMDQIEEMTGEKDNYIQEGITLIELAQRTENIYKNASPEVKRKLVEIVSSNRVLKDGSIEFYYRKPFNWLSEIEGGGGWWRWSESNRRPKSLPVEGTTCVVALEQATAVSIL